MGCEAPTDFGATMSLLSLPGLALPGTEACGGPVLKWIDVGLVLRGKDLTGTSSLRCRYLLSTRGSDITLKTDTLYTLLTDCPH